MSAVKRRKLQREAGCALVFLAIAVQLGGCHSPDLLFNTKSKSPNSAVAPTVSDLVDHLACEIGKVYEENTTLQTDNVSDQIAEANLKHNDRWKRLVENNFVAAIDLTLMVTRVQGVNPSVSYIWPLTGAGHTPNPIIYSGTGQTTATNNATLALGFQLNSTADRNVEQDFMIDMRGLIETYNFNQPSISEDQVRLAYESNHPNHDIKSSAFPYCLPRKGDTKPNFAVSSAPLQGNMQIFEMLEVGLTALDRASVYNIYGSGGPTRLADALPVGGIPGPHLAFVPSVSSISLAPGSGTTGGGSSTAGKTTFGAKVDFFITWGINGGPSLSLLNWKVAAGSGGGAGGGGAGGGSAGGGGSGGGGAGSGGAGGGGQLLSYTRTTQDSLTATFGATCTSPLTQPNIDATITIPPVHVTAKTTQGDPEVILQNGTSPRTLGYTEGMQIAGTNVALNTTLVGIYFDSDANAEVMLLSQPATGSGAEALTAPVIVEATDGDYYYEFTITLPHSFLVQSSDFAAGVFSTTGATTFDTITVSNGDGEIAKGTIQWTGVVLKTGEFSLRGVINSAVSGQTVGQIWLKGDGSKISPSGTQYFTDFIRYFPDRLTSKLNDDATQGYWDSLPGCDTLTAPQKQAAIDAITLQNQFQTFLRGQ